MIQQNERMLLKRVLIRVVMVVFFLAAVTGAIIYSENRSIAQSEALRLQLKEGMPWAEVAAKIEAEPHWHRISFHGETPDCGFVFGEGDRQLIINNKSTPIKDLLDPKIVAEVKRCPEVVMSFHPAFSFLKVVFAILFDSEGRVTSTTPTKTWD